MESLIEWLLQHAEHAHWYIFVAILLAGFNIPISADILLVMGGFLAATIIPEHLLASLFRNLHRVLLFCLDRLLVRPAFRKAVLQI